MFLSTLQRRRRTRSNSVEPSLLLRRVNFSDFSLQQFWLRLNDLVVLIASVSRFASVADCSGGVEIRPRLCHLKLTKFATVPAFSGARCSRVAQSDIANARIGVRFFAITSNAPVAKEPR